MQQSTQPQPLGYSLADSPVGLLAWIYEKLVNWTDNYPWDDDEGQRVCFYYQSLPAWKPEPTKIPMGFSYFPRELIRVPTKWLKPDNLVFEAEHTTGGHFSAHEKPDLLVGNMRKMFGQGRPAFGVVPGKAGYV